MKKFDAMEYKKRLIMTWNEIAPRYHKKWAKDKVGPFKSTKKLVSLTKIRRNHNVLDLACGTGAVTKQISKKIGNNGYVVGIDSSQTAINIARKYNHTKNTDFIVCDAEKTKFDKKFDLITCQYALFFFPNAYKVLKNARHALKKNGTIAISVHGKNVPFFSSILDVVTQYIPDYLPSGAPPLDRFATKTNLNKVIRKAGFKSVKINQYNFEYSPGRFSNYWNEYLRYIAKPLKEKINKLAPEKQEQLKEEIRKKTLPYTKRGIIKFPWQILIATATKQ
jgi:ubiquinone/menaquinone biosynthesis C-methylase UbiE